MRKPLARFHSSASFLRQSVPKTIASVDVSYSRNELLERLGSPYSAGWRRLFECRRRRLAPSANDSHDLDVQPNATKLTFGTLFLPYTHSPTKMQMFLNLGFMPCGNSDGIRAVVFALGSGHFPRVRRVRIGHHEASAAWPLQGQAGQREVPFKNIETQSSLAASRSLVSLSPSWLLSLSLWKPLYSLFRILIVLFSQSCLLLYQQQCSVAYLPLKLGR